MASLEKIKKPITPSLWTPESWREKPIGQQPAYPNAATVGAVEADLKAMPPLVSFDEIRHLKRELSQAAMGKAFLLQGGDCAESFAEFNETNLQNFFRVLIQMTIALMYGAGSPVVKVGRIAGQFAKPRSEATEKKNGEELPSYRGDMVNGMEFEAEARLPDPKRLVQAYYQSAATLNFLRSLARSGYAALPRVAKWNMDFVAGSPQGRHFNEIVERINDCLAFMNATGLNLDAAEEVSEARFYTSHESLLLNYDACLTRQDKTTGEYFAGSAHMLWIGDRTRNPDDAHVEFLRGVANPIGCKVGPSMTPEDLIRLCDTLNPKNEAGRLTFISRMGAQKVEQCLPALVKLLKDEGRHVVWSCDPMHGNTIKSPNGFKTRKFTDILTEVRKFFAIHHAEGTHGSGVHFEMTGQDVTECLGGAQAISELDLSDRYHTHCDPRLNASQSLELAFLIAELLKKQK
ncbi:MAG: 3-deoxy-7-phosphoheptulonate synthase class II [Alphaproteobacteria bacterium]|nr:3-deoxy-7-phosphoheptulonate synthase class II [Alphaproteobacteria bacterium]